MSYEEVIFYFVAALTVLGSLGVVTARNVVHSALFLILCAARCRGIFILLAAEFLAIVQVLDLRRRRHDTHPLRDDAHSRPRHAEALDGPQAPLAAVAAARLHRSQPSLLSPTRSAPARAKRSTSSPSSRSATPSSPPGPYRSRSPRWCSWWLCIGAIILARGEEGE